LLDSAGFQAGRTIAFSSEVATGSRQENASKQEAKARFRFNQNRTGFRPQKRLCGQRVGRSEGAAVWLDRGRGSTS